MSVFGHRIASAIRMLFGRKKETEDIIKVQTEKNVFSWQFKGTTFVYVTEPLREGMSVGGQASPGGVGGSFSKESERPIYHVVVFPSGSADPMPYEKWQELAGYVASTQSGGAVLPNQIGEVTFPLASRHALRPPSDLIKNRIREGFRLYRKGANPPDSVDVAFVSALANTIVGFEGDKLPPYYPLSEQDVQFELKSMASHGEVRIEGGKVRFTEGQYRT